MFLGIKFHKSFITFKNLKNRLVTTQISIREHEYTVSKAIKEKIDTRAKEHEFK